MEYSSPTNQAGRPSENHGPTRHPGSEAARAALSACRHLLPGGTVCLILPESREPEWLVMASGARDGAEPALRIGRRPWLEQALNSHTPQHLYPAPAELLPLAGLDGRLRVPALVAALYHEQNCLGALAVIARPPVYQFPAEIAKALPGLSHLVASYLARAPGPAAQNTPAQRFQRLHQQADTPVAVLDTELLIHEANAALAHVLGVAPDALTQRSLADFFAEPQLAPDVRATLRQGSASGMVFFETTLRGVDRALRQFAVHGSIITYHGQPMVKAFFRDITEQKQALAEMQRMNRQVGHILESTTDVYIAVDKEWHLTYVNARAEVLLGLQRQAMLGTALWDSIPELASAFFRCFRDAAASGQPATCEGFYPPTGKWLEAHIYPHIDGVSAYLRDITERTVAEQHTRAMANHLEELVQQRTADLAIARDQAQQADRTKSAFLANMSHELRTPLNAIIGYSEILREDAIDDHREQAAADLQKIRSAANHLLDLINDVLDLSKVEADKMELRLENVDVDSLVAGVVNTVLPMATRNANKLAIDCPQPIGNIYTDATRLRQCLLNLLSNACKFTQNGIVTLALKRERGSDENEWLTITATDTGIGMNDEQLARLFQPFSQVHHNVNTSLSGTGLGLALTRRLCRLMGGDVRAESQPGQGSRFTLLLPARTTDKFAAVR